MYSVNHFRALLAATLMLLAGGIAIPMTPNAKIADLSPRVDLEVLVPRQFGQWRVDDNVLPIRPSPEAEALLNRLYNQTLSRTYVSAQGDRVMLSIAYGGDQSDAMQVHRPEVCYSAQGFEVFNEVRGFLKTSFGQLPVKRLFAKQGLRAEPITYWITIGDKLTYAGFRQKLVQLSYGLTGKVPDGMLVRVSTIDPVAARAYELQDAFVNDLIDSLEPYARTRLIGTQL